MRDKYQVLWIDDESESMTSFVKFCSLRYKICLTPVKTQKKGLDEFGKNPSFWDAIILDAKGLDEDENEVAKLTGLYKAVSRIQKDFGDIPYFIYTGQPDLVKAEHFDQFCQSTYSHRYYKKGEDNDKLCKDIINAIEEKPIFKLKSKYSDIFSWLPAELTSEVLDLLSIVENGDNTNVDVFNKIRKVIDWTMRALNSYGILAVDFKGASLNECSSFLGRHELQQYIPSYIQRSFHSCTEIANEGSHRLRTDEDVRSGMAPYLVKSTTFELLNILMWYSKLPKDENTRRTITSFAVNLANKPKQDNNTAKERFFEYENKSFIIEIDDQGNYHCDKCLLNKTAAYHYLEQQVTLKNVTNNTSSTKNRYPYYSQFDPFDQK